MSTPGTARTTPVDSRRTSSTSSGSFSVRAASSIASAPASIVRRSTARPSAFDRILLVTTTTSPGRELDSVRADGVDEQRADVVACLHQREAGHAEQRHGRRRHARKVAEPAPGRLRPRRARMALMQAFGVYVHIPFCASRCDYCDFATWTDRAPPDRRLRRRVRARRRAPRPRRRPRACSSAAGRRRCSTPRSSPRILDAIPRAAGAEVTVECNPDSVDPAKLARLRARRA